MELISNYKFSVINNYNIATIMCNNRTFPPIEDFDDKEMFAF